MSIEREDEDQDKEDKVFSRLKKELSGFKEKKRIKIRKKEYFKNE